MTADTLNLEAFTAVLLPASQPGSGLPAPPDPAAFKDAVRNGGKVWALLCHFLAPLGQACLLRQRLASDLRTAERWCLVILGSECWLNVYGMFVLVQKDQLTCLCRKHGASI